MNVQPDDLVSFALPVLKIEDRGTVVGIDGDTVSVLVRRDLVVHIPRSAITHVEPPPLPRTT